MTDQAIMTLISGRDINLLDFKAGDVRVADIGHALSQVNRFGGHSPYPVSTALHSCNLVKIVPAELKQAAFIHDWSEAFVNDLVSSLKQQCPDFQKIEDNIQMVIFDVMGVPWEHMDAIHSFDTLIGNDEWRQLFRPGDHPIETVPLEELTWREARDRFFNVYTELFT